MLCWVKIIAFSIFRASKTYPKRNMCFLLSHPFLCTCIIQHLNIILHNCTWYNDRIIIPFELLIVYVDMFHYAYQFLEIQPQQRNTFNIKKVLVYLFYVFSTFQWILVRIWFFFWSSYYVWVSKSLIQF